MLMGSFLPSAKHMLWLMLTPFSDDAAAADALALSKKNEIQFAAKSLKHNYGEKENSQSTNQPTNHRTIESSKQPIELQI